MPENITLPDLKSNAQYPAIQACDLTLGFLANSAACCSFNLAEDVAARLGHHHQFTPPWANQLARDSSSPEDQSKSHVIVDPHVTEIVKAEGESPDIDSPHDLASTSEQRSLPDLSSEFSTNVDSLMRTIQLQSKRPQRQPSSFSISDLTPPRSSPDSDTMQPEPSRRDPKRRKPQQIYQCSEPSCAKTFHQRTHLEIHERAHTGYKPFVRGKLRGASQNLNTDIWIVALQGADMRPAIFAAWKPEGAVGCI